MHPVNEDRVVNAGLLGDALTAVLKWIVAIISRSASMFAEALHSTADCASGVSLKIGIYRSRRPADDEHPFGSGKEMFLWALAANLIMFFLIALYAIYGGIVRMLNPRGVEHFWLAISVLAAGFAFNLYSLRIGIKESRKGDGNGVISLIRTSQAQGAKTTMIEDIVGLAGIVIAAVSITLSQYIRVIDGAGSVAVGVLLAGFALYLGKQNHELLVGKGLGKATQRDIIGLAESMDEVKKVRKLKSMILATDNVLVNMEINFVDGLSTDSIERAIDKIESAIRENYPEVGELYIEPES